MRVPEWIQIAFSLGVTVNSIQHRSPHSARIGGEDGTMPKTRILVVDDDDDVRDMLQQALEDDGTEVVVAGNVREALGHIVAENFDVLLSDLHMPNAGDGFTVVSAMHHMHPQAVTLVLSGYPELQEAMSAICSQA